MNRVKLTPSQLSPQDRVVQNQALRLENAHLRSCNNSLVKCLQVATELAKLYRADRAGRKDLEPTPYDKQMAEIGWSWSQNRH